ncbi:hypothetical protein [Pseudomonas sp. PGPR40]|uniref:hypothetical protein n=1 Tax=Pseudomonas sp. PGPR40 TaxID=2913476 RepID=UPI001EDAFDD7|nr:hypothetical protein [Pseudomonas sp. PGPR40]
MQSHIHIDASGFELDQTLHKLEEMLVIRPSPGQAEHALGQFLKLCNVSGENLLPTALRRDIETLRKSITSKAAQSASQSSEKNDLQLFPAAPEQYPWAEWENTPGLLSLLAEIERKSDFHEEVVISGPRWPKNIAARLVFIVNALDTCGIPSLGKSLIAYAKPTHPVKEQKADSQQTIVSRAQTNVTLEQPSNAGRQVEPLTAPTRDRPVHEPVYSERASAVVRMAEQVAELDTFMTQAITGYRPVEGAIDAPDPMRLLADIRNFAESVSVRTPLRQTPASSFGNVDSPYADTVITVTNESDEDDTWRAMGNQLGTWLQVAAGYLASMGMSTVQQHPHATATIAMAALYAVVNEFYNRWFPDNVQTLPIDAHFAEETNPQLRKHITEDVELLLGTLPEVSRAVRERIANSTYENPHQDPHLVTDVDYLLQQPVSAHLGMSYKQLIEETVEHSLDIYVHDEATTNERSERKPRAAEYVLDALIDLDTPLKADSDLQSNVIEMLDSNQNGPLAIPAGTSIHEPLELYKQALDDSKLLAWFEIKGMNLTTLRIHSDFVTHEVTHGGESTQEKFTLWDDSGWWQVSAQLLDARNVLDPGDVGLGYMNEASNELARDVLLQFYGVTPPLSEEGAERCAAQLKSQGWPEFNRARLQENLETVKQAIGEAEERERLALDLEQSVSGMANNASVTLSDQYADIAGTSPLARKSQEARRHLKELLELPAMIELGKANNFNCFENRYRIFENKLQCFTYMNGWTWRDLTDFVSDQPILKEKLNKLIPMVKEIGHVLYNSESYNLQQVLRFKGFDLPKNAEDVRNIIQWLKTPFPPSPALGNYAADLLRGSPATVTLSQNDKTKIIEASKEFLSEGGSIIDQVVGGLLKEMSVEGRRDNADVLLGALLGAAQSDTWGSQLLTKLNWYGSSEGQTPTKQHYQQLLLAAIKLGVDPVASGKSGTIAGYEIYQPSNLGRGMGAVREDIERHLINKGVSALSAPLVAHIFLADIAPEFLVHNKGENILMGSSNWMSQRLGAAVAEMKSPGCSRSMTPGQLNELSMLEPVTTETRLLFQVLGVDILVGWGVMNGVIRQSTESNYSLEDYTNSANRYAQQRAELSRAFKACTQPLRTRRELAIIELRKVFPGLSVGEIEAKKLWSTSLSEDWNLKASTGRDHGLIEIYMAGDLKEGDWFDSRKGWKHPELDRAIRKLPDLTPIVTASVDAYFEEFKEAFIAPSKLLISTLPLEDRQRLELGKVELFTLREETGRLKENETPEMQAAYRGKHGTLIRCEYQTSVSYFELFPGQMKIIKRTDLPDVLPLNGKMKTEKAKVSSGPAVNAPVQRGTDLPFDFQAYSTGSQLRANVSSSKLIIEKLGSDFPGTPLQASDNQTSYVPNIYFSDKISRIVNSVIVDNFLLGQRESLLKQAKGSTSREEKQATLDSIGDYLLKLIPFVGCIQDLISGTRMGLINGAFGCYTDVVAGLNGLVRGAGKVVGLLKSAVPVRLKAFDALQTTVSTVVSAINPLSGFGDLLVGG